MHTDFADHFSTVADQYAAYQPHYPASLFEYLAALAPDQNLAWDCATGTGQAAIALVRHFDSVIATDASAEQIANVTPHPWIEYRVTHAEHSRLETGSADLITVAQASHWFDLPAFYAEARRILKPGGVLAVWCYGKVKFATSAVRSVLGRFYHSTVGPYWPRERRLVEEGYRSLPFPFAEIEPPAFHLEAEFTSEQLAGYVRTWSATQRFYQATGKDPVPELVRSLNEAWQNQPRPITIRWPLALRVCRAPPDQRLFTPS
jgi:ubiquinone/menaquinone biosynthesis C-methylase UbiE